MRVGVGACLLIAVGLVVSRPSHHDITRHTSVSGVLSTPRLQAENQTLSLPGILQLLNLAQLSSGGRDLEKFEHRFGRYEQAALLALFSYAASAFGLSNYETYYSDDGMSFREYMLSYEELESLRPILRRTPPIKDISMAISQYLTIVDDGLEFASAEEYKNKFLSMMEVLGDVTTECRGQGKCRLQEIRDRIGRFALNLNYGHIRGNGGDANAKVTSCHFVRELLYQKGFVTDQDMIEAHSLWTGLDPVDGEVDGGYALCAIMHEGVHAPYGPTKFLHPVKGKFDSEVDCKALCVPTKMCGHSPTYESLYETLALLFNFKVLLSDGVEREKIGLIDECTFQLAYATMRRPSVPQPATGGRMCSNDELCPEGTYCCNSYGRSCCPVEEGTRTESDSSYFVSGMPAQDFTLNGIYFEDTASEMPLYVNSEGSKLAGTYVKCRESDSSERCTRWTFSEQTRDKIVEKYFAVSAGQSTKVLRKRDAWRSIDSSSHDKIAFQIRKMATNLQPRQHPTVAELRDAEGFAKSYVERVFYSFARCSEIKSTLEEGSPVDNIGVSFYNFGNMVQVGWVSQWLYDPASNTFDIGQIVSPTRDDTRLGSLPYAEALFSAILKANDPSMRYVRIPFVDSEGKPVRLTKDHILNYMKNLQTRVKGVAETSVDQKADLIGSTLIINEFGSTHQQSLSIAADSLTWPDFLAALTQYGRLYPGMTKQDVTDTLTALEWGSDKLDVEKFMVFQSCIEQYAEMVQQSGGQFDDVDLDRYLRTRKRDTTLVLRQVLQNSPQLAYGHSAVSIDLEGSSSEWGSLFLTAENSLAFTSVYADHIGSDKLGDISNVKAMPFTCKGELSPLSFPQLSRVPACTAAEETRIDDQLVLEPGTMGCPAKQARVGQRDGCIDCDNAIRVVMRVAVPSAKVSKIVSGGAVDLKSALLPALSAEMQVISKRLVTEITHSKILDSRTAILTATLSATTTWIVPTSSLMTELLAFFKSPQKMVIRGVEITVLELADDLTSFTNDGVKSACACACARVGRRYHAKGICEVASGDASTASNVCRLADFMKLCKRSFFMDTETGITPYAHQCNLCADSSCSDPPNTCQSPNGVCDTLAGECRYKFVRTEGLCTIRNGNRGVCVSTGESEDSFRDCFVGLEMGPMEDTTLQGYDVEEDVNTIAASTDLERDMCSRVWQDSTGTLRDLMGRVVPPNTSCWQRAIQHIERRLEREVEERVVEPTAGNMRDLEAGSAQLVMIEPLDKVFSEVLVPVPRAELKESQWGLDWLAGRIKRHIVIQPFEIEALGLVDENPLDFLFQGLRIIASVGGSGQGIQASRQTFKPTNTEDFCGEHNLMTQLGLPCTPTVSESKGKERCAKWVSDAHHVSVKACLKQSGKGFELSLTMSGLNQVPALVSAADAFNPCILSTRYPELVVRPFLVYTVRGVTFASGYPHVFHVPSRPYLCFEPAVQYHRFDVGQVNKDGQPVAEVAMSVWAPLTSPALAVTWRRADGVGALMSSVTSAPSKGGVFYTFTLQINTAVPEETTEVESILTVQNIEGKSVDSWTYNNHLDGTREPLISTKAVRMAGTRVTSDEYSVLRRDLEDELFERQTVGRLRHLGDGEDGGKRSELFPRKQEGIAQALQFAGLGPEVSMVRVRYKVANE